MAAAGMTVNKKSSEHSELDATWATDPDCSQFRLAAPNEEPECSAAAASFVHEKTREENCRERGRPIVLVSDSLNRIIYLLCGGKPSTFARRHKTPVASIQALFQC